MIIHKTCSGGSEEVEEVNEFTVSMDNRTLQKYYSTWSLLFVAGVVMHTYGDKILNSLLIIFLQLLM